MKMVSNMERQDERGNWFICCFRVNFPFFKHPQGACKTLLKTKNDRSTK